MTEATRRGHRHRVHDRQLRACRGFRGRGPSGERRCHRLSLTGNEFANNIVGGAGKDTLSGGGGNDTLNGGVGVDTMAGGAGNDTYNVDNVGDVVNEAAGDGTDTVHTTVSYALAAGSEIEFLRVSGTAGLSLTGNEFANTLVGGNGADTLIGGAGNDVLNSGAGNDLLTGGAGNDTMNGGAGSDVFSLRRRLRQRPGR